MISSFFINDHLNLPVTRKMRLLKVMIAQLNSLFFNRFLFADSVGRAYLAETARLSGYLNCCTYVRIFVLNTAIVYFYVFVFSTTQKHRKWYNAFLAIVLTCFNHFLFRCIRCPTAFHAGNDCIAAGSIILPGLNMICADHFEPLKTTPYHQPVHVSWCFICSKGTVCLC